MTSRITCPQCGGSGNIPAEDDYRTAPNTPHAVQTNAPPLWRRVGFLVLLVGGPTYAWLLSGLLADRLEGLGIWAILAFASSYFILSVSHWRTSTIVLATLYWPVSWSYFVLWLGWTVVRSIPRVSIALARLIGRMLTAFVAWLVRGEQRPIRLTHARVEDQPQGLHDLRETTPAAIADATEEDEVVAGGAPSRRRRP